MNKDFLNCLIILLIFLSVFYFNHTEVATDTQLLEVSSGNQLTNEIKVVSYNIHFGTTRNLKPGISQITTFLSSLNSDIICLQEVDNSSARSLFLNHPQILQEKLSMEIYYYEGDDVALGKTGNLILSKYPILSKESIKLPSQKYMRIAQKVTLDTPMGNVQVINTHLGLSKKIRKQQIDTIVNWISDDSIPTIIAGDFNTDNPEELDKLLSQFNDTGLLMNKAHINTFEDKKYQSRIDYIFVSNIFKINAYEVSNFNHSDHFPILVDLELNLEDL